MILDNLFRKVLIEPTEAGANTLFVVSGYASPAIVYKHLSNLPETTVHLLIGMATQEGIRLGSHNVFKKLELGGNLCNLIVNPSLYFLSKMLLVLSQQDFQKGHEEN